MKGILRDLAIRLSKGDDTPKSSSEIWDAISREWQEIAEPSEDHLHGLLTLCKTPPMFQYPKAVFDRACLMAQTLNVNTPRIERLILELALWTFYRKLLSKAETLASLLWRAARSRREHQLDASTRWSDDVCKQTAALVLDIYRVQGERWAYARIAPKYLAAAAQTIITDECSTPELRDQSIPIELLIIRGFRTPLQWAVENGWGELVDHLVDSGAIVNAKGAEDSG